MHLNLETIIIGVLVLGAAIWAARAAWRSVTHAGGCSSCSSSGDCPLMKNPDALFELQQRSGSASCPEHSGKAAPKKQD